MEEVHLAALMFPAVHVVQIHATLPLKVCFYILFPSAHSDAMIQYDARSGWENEEYESVLLFSIRKETDYQKQLRVCSYVS